MASALVVGSIVPATARATTPALTLPPPSTATATAATDGEADADADAIAGLRYDLRKLVFLRQQSGWAIDRYEIEALLPNALLSVCALRPALRARAVADLAAERAAAGDGRASFAAAGGDREAVADLLYVDRVWQLADEAVRRSARECPYYRPPQPRFRGRQRDVEVLTLNAEGGGLASFSVRGGVLRAGGGGAGRISLGVGLSEQWTLRLGPEIAGAALIDQQIRADDVALDFIMALPIALRRNVSAYLFDVELAPLIFGIPWQSAELRYGGRLAVLGGVSAVRIRELLPWTGVVLMVEAIAPSGAEPAQVSVRAGVRFGFAWRLTAPRD